MIWVAVVLAGGGLSALYWGEHGLACALSLMAVLELLLGGKGREG